MNTNRWKCLAVSLTPAAILALTSCSSTPSTARYDTTTAVAFREGVPGGVAVETHKMTAKVTGIDAAGRKVVVSQEGKETTLKCGPEVINFDQIRVGDQIKVVATEELVAYLAEAGAAPSDGAVTAVALAPRGTKPGGVIADTVQVTAKITTMDLRRHRATLQFPDGTCRTVAVRRDVDLTRRHVGEEVVIRITERVAISIEKP